MIRLEDVSKRFGNEQVLRHIGFHVGSAECLIVLGSNGSGKSTLMKLILGLVDSDGGSIKIGGQEITFCGWGDEGGWEEDEIEEHVLRLLGFVELEHTIDMMPSELSGGMRRRVAIARAMMGNPRILLYDDPTAGLDPVTARSICDLLIKLRDLEGVTSIVVTSDLNTAYFLSSYSARLDKESGAVFFDSETNGLCYIHTKFCVLEHGNIIFGGTLKELQQSRDPFIQEFIT